jgi:UDPglucose 6-dehydrogenase
MKRLSVIGLGKLGACTAACFAAKGYPVVGLDINKDFVDAVNSGSAPVEEPRLQEMIELSKGRLRATQDFDEVIRDSEATFLVVPTPSKEDGHFSDRYLRDALTRLSESLKKSEKDYHTFVITSTVSPGNTRRDLIPLIESVSGKKMGEGFSVAYNPEFIALGSVVSDFLNPDMVLIGESDGSVGDTLAEIYGTVCENRPYIARMSLESAEVTKISLNSYITMKISFANTLAMVCQEIPGANIDDITAALGADKRISPYYLKGGLSYGGPCFPRDNRAFAAFAADYGVDALLAKTTDDINSVQIHRVVELVLSHISEGTGNAVAVLGISYKPNTPVIEESASLKLIESLLKKDMEVIVYDPLAMENARVHFGDNVLFASSIKDCLERASMCIITTPDDEFRNMDESLLTRNPMTVIDCWRILDEKILKEKVKYIAVGRAA